MHVRKPSYIIKVPQHRLEWPTILLTIVIYGGFLALTWWWHALPLPVVALAGGWLIAWHGSLQHEVIHGHPTGNQQINNAIGSIPLSLWLPYEIYRESHLEHHRDEHLTDPSRIPNPPISPRQPGSAWGRGQGACALEHDAVRAADHRSGRDGVELSGQEARLLRAGEPGRARIWTIHLIGAAIVLLWVTASAACRSGFISSVSSIWGLR